MFFDRAAQPEVAAGLYGATTHHPAAHAIVGDLPVVVAHLRAVLGDGVLSQYAASGAAMETGEIVAYARQNIRTARTG